MIQQRRPSLRRLESVCEVEPTKLEPGAQATVSASLPSPQSNEELNPVRQTTHSPQTSPSQPSAASKTQPKSSGFMSLFSCIFQPPSVQEPRETAQVPPPAPRAPAPSQPDPPKPELGGSWPGPASSGFDAHSQPLHSTRTTFPLPPARSSEPSSSFLDSPGERHKASGRRDMDLFRQVVLRRGEEELTSKEASVPTEFWGLDPAELMRACKVPQPDVFSDPKGTERSIQFRAGPGARGHTPLMGVTFQSYGSAWKELDAEQLEQLNVDLAKQSSHLMPFHGFSIHRERKRFDLVSDIMPCGSLLQILLKLEPSIRGEAAASFPPTRTMPLMPCTILSHLAHATLTAILQRRQHVGPTRAVIQPQTLLFHPDGAIKLLDLPLQAKVLNMTCGTEIILEFLGYSPPEKLLEGSSCTESDPAILEAADVWALGIILLEAARGRHPFYQVCSKGPMHMIQEADKGAAPEVARDDPVFPKLSPHFHTLVAGCLRRDPRRRSTVEDLLKHPFLHECLPYDEVESLHELSPNTSRNERQEGSLEREGWHDKARRQCVQRWLYECSVRHDGIKETVRAVVVHFYKILNMETDWGDDCVVIRLLNEDLHLQLSDAMGSEHHIIGAIKVAHALRDVRVSLGGSKFSVKSTKVLPSKSLTSNRFKCKVIGWIGTAPIKHTLVIKLPFKENETNVCITEMELQVDGSRYKPIYTTL
mmetsp:Transcript_35854/g.67596  ORF Transcript_35854/g.67596 Transcript_35854/m.67596 type:complete len:705 (+) Transcript_35854:372-2486(+)